MATIERMVLRPVHFRGGLLCPDDVPDVELSWPDVVQRLAVDQQRSSKMVLRGARPGDFIGIRMKGGKLVTFIIGVRATRTANVQWLLKKIPDFGESVREIFRVERVFWEARMVESVA